MSLRSLARLLALACACLVLTSADETRSEDNGPPPLPPLPPYPPPPPDGEDSNGGGGDTTDPFSGVPAPAWMSTNPDDVEFYLYNDPNNLEKADRLLYNDLASVRAAQFVPGAPLIFLTHGFSSSFNSPNSLVPFVKNAYLKAGYSNVIAVNWEKLAETVLFPGILQYALVMNRGVPVAGQRLCDMILYLNKLGIVDGPENVHLVGHSLGAHVSGIAGACVRKALGVPVNRISGLDPAGFEYKLVPEHSLDPTDAEFVDVIHTSTNTLGTDHALGTVDFYANGGGGNDQPLCNQRNVLIRLADRVGACGHSMAYQYFARSILRTMPDLYGCACGPPDGSNACEKAIGTCEEPTLFGQYVRRTARGKFYLNIPGDLPGLGVVPQ